MNDIQFIYSATVGLLAHISVILLITFVLDKVLDDAYFACHLWTGCFVLILALPVVVAFCPAFAFDLAFLLKPFISASGKGQQALALLAIVGIATLASIRLLAGFRLNRWMRLTAKKLTDDELAHVHQIVPEAIKVKRIVSSDEAIGPFCHGQFRSTIVIPSYLLEESDWVLKHAVLHELAHLQHHHPRQLLLQNLCTTIYWFHPMVWWAAERASITREYLCDEVVVQQDGDVANYLRTLAVVAERSTEKSQQMDQLEFVRRSSFIRRSERLVRIATRSNRPPSRWRKLAALAVLLILIAAITAWLLKSSSFAPQTQSPPQQTF
ncbi:Regulatory protein BlaR1 [Stieleria varia]|uniref:Regulatory protein BlaR1 n=2 Tax=Stieleria varia TaxID=2528005 RepID=A0A5C6BD94_9BACT|nr:Regulatory protein BlaR1 [Stieleria varia]